MFDTIAVEHECPTCHAVLPDYQTKELTNTLVTFRLGDKINFGHGSKFEFEIHDFCSKCGISMEGVGLVKITFYVKSESLVTRNQKNSLGLKESLQD